MIFLVSLKSFLDYDGSFSVFIELDYTKYKTPNQERLNHEN